jgi:hypothetical protein
LIALDPLVVPVVGIGGSSIDDARVHIISYTAPYVSYTYDVPAAGLAQIGK